ncbi:MAG: DUF1624 domain-containing protein [bacterium]|nr:DUF1624 domain-containing protein [bacterium]
MTERFNEIDILRGVAVIGMVLYHAAFDAYFIYGWPISIDSLPLVVLGKVAALLFITLAGMSSWLLFRKATLQKWSTLKYFTKVWQISTMLALGALLLTTATAFLFPIYTIWFGILHYMAVAKLLLSLICKIRVSPLVLVVILGALWWGFYGLRMEAWYLLPFGIRSSSFASLDYYPLLPWLAWSAFGVWLGQQLYPIAGEAHRVHISASKATSFLTITGQNSYLIYLLHQPIIIALLWLLN